MKIIARTKSTKNDSMNKDELSIATFSWIKIRWTENTQMLFAHRARFL